METRILRVVKCGELFSVKSEKSENGQLDKRILVLQELGGKYADQFCATLLGNAAALVFYENEIVVCTLRFAVRDYNGQTYQDITVTDICKK
ncbi:MAG: hypothetical protein K6D37_07225 [Prevotella sp.]|nr:hypothetical protein [Prevotella sp.]